MIRGHFSLKIKIETTVGRHQRDMPYQKKSAGQYNPAVSPIPIPTSQECEVGGRGSCTALAVGRQADNKVLNAGNIVPKPTPINNAIIKKSTLRVQAFFISLSQPARKKKQH